MNVFLQREGNKLKRHQIEAEDTRRSIKIDLPTWQALKRREADTQRPLYLQIKDLVMSGEQPPPCGEVKDEGGEGEERPNVRRYSAAVLCSMGGSILGDVIFSLGRGYWIVAAGQAVLLLSPLAACRWWWTIGGAGEGFTPTPGPSREDLDTEWEQITKEIKSRAAGAGE